MGVNSQTWMMMVPAFAVYVGLGLAYVIPAPYGAVVMFAFIFGSSGWTFFQQKVAKWWSQWMKQKWLTIDSDYDWEGQLQLWYTKEPALTSKWLSATKEWISFIGTVKPFRHPKYNDKRPIYGFFLRHGLYSFRSQGYTFTEEEAKDLSNWTRLFPGKAGWAFFLNWWVRNPNSDRAWVEEIVPTAEELVEADQAIKEKTTLLNHVPIVIDGIAYPVAHVMRATGSQQIEKSLKARRAAQLPNIPLNGEATAEDMKALLEPQIIMVRGGVKKN